MLKRFSFLLLLSPLLMGLSSCGGSEAGQVRIPYGRLYDASLSGTNQSFDIIEDHATLAGMLTASGEAAPLNFILLVKGSEDTCICWQELRETVYRYMESTNARIYLISYDAFGSEDTYGLDIKKGYDTIAVFSNGKLAYQRANISDGDAFATDYDVFHDWMSARVSVSDMLYVTKSQLDDLYGGGIDVGGNFVVGYLRGSCSDCSYLAYRMLKDHNDGEWTRSYLFDCDVEGVRYYNGAVPDESGTADEQEAYAQWQAFKDDYGLSDAIDADFGYGTGYVPTFQHCLQNATETIKPASCVTDMAVYANDTLAANDDGTYRVSASYYDGSRSHEFIDDNPSFPSGLETDFTKIDNIPVDNVTVVNGEAYWNHDASSIYHDRMLEAFLSFYCQEID
jgi:hypothetical protein